MSGATVLPRVRGFSPTARLVYLALADGGHHTADELLESTGANTSSLVKALRRLRDADLVETEPHPVDGRRRHYTLADDNPHASREYAAVNSGSHPSEQPESAGRIKTTPQEGEHGR